jgi:hypothetical protein
LFPELFSVGLHSAQLWNVPKSPRDFQSFLFA